MRQYLRVGHGGRHKFVAQSTERVLDLHGMLLIEDRQAGSENTNVVVLIDAYALRARFSLDQQHAMQQHERDASCALMTSARSPRRLSSCTSTQHARSFAWILSDEHAGPSPGSWDENSYPFHRLATIIRTVQGKKNFIPCIATDVMLQAGLQVPLLSLDHWEKRKDTKKLLDWWP